eukprot:TRINITY_DN5510_c0_g1::TRINITY_DN5510_c0_g1_i1::g.9374::m.9374 TRINITY_DN5510_c0_g1::TRINITY_DN5510_c0_g1_i1::g.9374  ORF type:complete len:166 (+),score=16.10,TMF_DNA_bd/PF12329.3/0.002,RTBV_P46/PF06216.6/0.015,DUF4140/PF13600.1/0.018,Med9/PF07544.8/0.031,SlyX/PF04102.7/0.044,Prefoldin/PF02996.12/0.073,Prefoldin_2/PF01920.15/0.098,Prefoldin_2/PF01920.15/6.7e+03,Pox_A_type_inc/PF04508.7/2.5e+03,Pox_A_type_inc/PF04508.7/0.47,DUF2076/PF09849.4/0.18 TRINITY_DN5510_c0_g1_i1:12-509(+)
MEFSSSDHLIQFHEAVGELNLAVQDFLAWNDTLWNQNMVPIPPSMASPVAVVGSRLILSKYHIVRTATSIGDELYRLRTGIAQDETIHALKDKIAELEKQIERKDTQLARNEDTIQGLRRLSKVGNAMTAWFRFILNAKDRVQKRVGKNISCQTDPITASFLYVT